MRIDILAALPHYVDHLKPVWDALPREARGVFAARGAGAQRAAKLGLRHEANLERSDRLTLVAAHTDYKLARTLGRPVAYLNHGVGQSWRDPSGRLIPTGCGEARDGVVVFLTPGPHATSVTREANGPAANIVEVGSAKVETLRRHPKPAEPLLVFSTHWDHTEVPESRSVLGEYLPAVTELAKDLPVAIHAHPRVTAHWRLLAKRRGIEFIETFDEVCERGTAYATDASSTLFEFAALDRPVIVLNGMKYRRHHQHGLRFWQASRVGVNADGPGTLRQAVAHALEDPPHQQRLRREAVALAYHPFDGLAADRAVNALLAAAAQLRAA